MEPDSVFVKLDISNAFNSLHRDRMLSSVNSLLPVPAFLASAVGTLVLQSDILRQLKSIHDLLVEDFEAKWIIESGITIPNSFPTHMNMGPSGRNCCFIGPFHSYPPCFQRKSTWPD